MRLAEVAPALPAIPFGLLALGSAIAFVVSWGLLHGWAQTFGRLFQWLGNKAIHVPIPAAPDINLRPFGFLLNLDQDVRHALSVAVAATEHAMVYSFQRMIGIVLWSAQETAGLAVDAYNAIQAVHHLALTHGAKVVRQTVVKPVATAVRYTDAKLTGRVNALTHRLDALTARVAHASHVAAGAITAPFPRIGRVERDLSGLRKRVGSLEKQIAAGVGVALLVRALAQAGLGWLRCRNVSKAGKAVCQMDAGVLESLLLDAAVLAVAFNLEDFAREMQAVTEDAASLIHKWAT